jgi:hypothetical protein
MGQVAPFLGVYLTDLTFIEDGNADFLPVPAPAPAPTPVPVPVPTPSRQPSTRGGSSTGPPITAPRPPAGALASTSLPPAPAPATAASVRLVNFDKRRKLSRSIAEIRLYQQERYALHAIVEIQTFLCGARGLDERVLLKRSLDGMHVGQRLYDVCACVVVRRGWGWRVLGRLLLTLAFTYMRVCVCLCVCVCVCVEDHSRTT